MKTRALIRKLADRFPRRLAERGDYVGLMTGRLKDETNTVVLCLDFDEEVMSLIEGQERKVDLILTHHPFIYGTKHKVFQQDEIKRRLCARVDELDIPVYSMHTNFDAGRDGMNDALASALGLSDIRPLETCPMARGGRLAEKTDIRLFAKSAARRLRVPYGLLTQGGKAQIETVAIVGGGGSSCYGAALSEGYDLFISGDAPHHIRRSILAHGYNFLDLPHEIEKIFIPQMKKIIAEFDEDLFIIAIDHEKAPEVIR